MNFTREPIIETIITPREGFKLVVRNSKGGGEEEYVVDAIEVVSFGHSFFFRSLERPKSFLVPVSDYEVVETKETRVVLKNLNLEKTIKISGGRETTIKANKEPTEGDGKKTAATVVEQRLDKKRERRRHRRRRPQEGQAEESQVPSPEAQSEESDAPSAPPPSEEPKIPSLSRLIPPPPGLISESLGRKKEEEAPSAPTEEAEDQTEKKRRKKEEPSEEEDWKGDAQDMLRISGEPVETATRTSFFRLFLP